MKLNYDICVPLWTHHSIPNQKDFEEVYDDIHDERIWHVGMPRMNLYCAANPKGVTALICPGGAYRKLNPIYEGEKIARELNAMGINCYVLISRLPNQKNLLIRHAAPIQDVQRAMRMIKTNHPDDYTVALGISAGGHLISTLPFFKDESAYGDKFDNASYRPDVMVMISSATIMDKHNDWTHQHSRENFGMDLSTYKHVTHTHPPTFLAHATDDRTVSVIHTLIYAEALAVHKVPFEMHVPSIGDHGVCHLLNEWNYRLHNFIKAQTYEKENNTKSN